MRCSKRQRREAGDAAEQLMEGAIEVGKDLMNGNVDLTATIDIVSLGYSAISTSAKSCHALIVQETCKHVPAAFDKDMADRLAKNVHKKAAAKSFKVEGAVDAVLGVATIAKAVCDDVKNGSCLETLKAGSSLVADFASKTMKEPCSLLSGNNLCVAGKLNSVTLKTSSNFKLAKLNPVTTALGAVEAGWNSYREGSVEPLVDFVGSTTGNVVGQMVGRSVGGAIGSLFGPVGTTIGAGIGGALGGFLGEKVWHRVRRGRVEKRPKKAWSWPWF